MYGLSPDIYIYIRCCRSSTHSHCKCFLTPSQDSPKLTAPEMSTEKSRSCYSLNSSIPVSSGMKSNYVIKLPFIQVHNVIPSFRAIEMNCTNALHPDSFGHYREAKVTAIKHHWWWKVCVRVCVWVCVTGSLSLATVKAIDQYTL